MAYDDGYDDEYMDDLPAIDEDDTKPFSPHDDESDDDSLDEDVTNEEESSGFTVHKRDPVDTPVIPTASSSVSSANSSNSSVSDDEKDDDISSLLEDDIPDKKKENPPKQNELEQVTVPQENKAGDKSSFAPVDSGLGAYVPYAMMAGGLVHSDSSDKNPSILIKSGTPVTSDSFREKSKKVIALEKQMSSIDTKIIECRANVAKWDKKYNQALSTDTVLAGNYKQSKMQEESQLTSLQAQKKSLEEKIKMAVELDDITYFSSNADRLLPVVSSISNSSFDIDFDVLSTEIDTTSAHLSTLLASVGKKIDTYSSLLHSASDDIARDRFHSLYDFYHKLSITLMDSCQTMEKVRKIFTAKYNQHKQEIDQSKQLAVLLSEMQPNNFLYSLFTNLGNQVYALQKHIDSLNQHVNSLETQLTEYKNSNVQLSQKVNSFNDQLQKVNIIMDDDTTNKLAERLSGVLQNSIESHADDISHSISDTVSKDFSSVIDNLNDSSQKISEAASATEVIRDTNELLTQVKSDKDEIKQKMLDNVSSLTSALHDTMDKEVKSVFNSNLSLLRKSLFLTGRTVFEGFAKSYGILGQNRSLMFYLTSPVCVLLLMNFFLTLYILYSLHFSD